MTVSKYWLTQRSRGLPIRNAAGDPIGHGKMDQGLILIRELEDFVRSKLPSKMPDVEPFTMVDGEKLFPFNLMFLLPVRGLEEEARKNILDTNRYFSIGRLSDNDIRLSFGAAGSMESLFSKYSETDDDRKLTISPHALRHLQNAELFRLGVADTIITKRFNRRSVKQSYEYDHRSLLEELDNIELPPESVEVLSPKALDVFRLISGRKIEGPIVEEFRQIQRQQGDVAAFEFLNAEADGFHVTPYGFCVNSFTVDPCPKHLECFNGCRHLTMSAVPEERKNLEELYERFKRAIESINSVPEAKRGIGWKNQIRHAETRLKNIELALNTTFGEKPFPDGPDLFEATSEHVNQTVIDDK
nr:hypothetical protein DBT41_09420 [Aerococcus urinae]